MNQKISFSIVCPVYNAEKTLSSSVESVIKQTYGNWNLILVDDGSNDLSGKICDEFVKKDSRINAIHKQNEGQAKARLDGIQVSQGDYILFLDSDDEYEKNALETICKKLSEKEINFLVYNARKITENQDTNLYDLSTPIDSPIIECFCKRRVSYLWSLCIRRDLFGSIERETFETFSKLTYSEDLYLIYNIVKKVKNGQFFVLDEKLYRYKTNSSSITNNQNAKKLLDRFGAFNCVYEDLFKTFPDEFKKIIKEEKDSAGWTALSAARRIALEFEPESYFKEIKSIRKSFLFKHLMKFKKDKYNLVAYILLKLKMYRCFRKYIIKNGSK